jgi:adenosylmethionine-8-amino-7-oxononanoate aminotransferase
MLHAQAEPATQQDAVFRRDWTKSCPQIVNAEGLMLEDDQGRRYLDAVSGIFVVNIGYGVASVGEAMARQAAKIAFVYAGDFATEAETALAQKIVSLAPNGFSKAYFVSGGSEANEVAFKIARKYQRAKKRDSRWRIVSRWQSYHGATMATLSASGKVSRRSDFLPYMLDFPRAPTANAYRRPDGVAPEEYGRLCAEEIDRRIVQEDPASIAALIVEPLTGAGSGALVPPNGYMDTLRTVCDRHDILLIADEVVTGFGRTGEMFASQHFDVQPDIITFGKGIASGYAPLAGVLISDHVIRTIEASEATSLFTGYTYSGHAVSCAAGLEVLNVMERQGYVRKVREDGEWFFQEALSRLPHPVVGDIRGRGFLMGVEFVEDRATKRPFAPEKKFYQRVITAAREKGLLIRGENGCIDGVHGDHILLAPSFCATRRELGDILDRLAEAIDRAARAVS